MIPIKLTMENFISHSKSEIDFSKFDVALVVGMVDNNVGASNGVGKTSIFEAIRYSLYNKTRFGTKEKVVKDGKNKCRVEFIFSVVDDVYKVIRSFNKKSGVGDIELYRKMDSDWQSENCDTPTATTQKIIDIIGMSHDTFVNSVCFRQNDMSGFAGAPASKRKEILKEVLQIGIWDDYHEAAKENGKDLIRKKVLLEQRIAEIGIIEEQKKSNEVAAKNIEDNIISLEEKISKLSDELSEFSEKIIKLEVQSNSKNNIDKTKLEKKLKDITDRTCEIKNLKLKLKQEFEKNNDLLSKATNDCFNLEKKLAEYARDVLCVNHKHREKAASICKDDVEILFSQESLSSNKELKNNLQRELDVFSMQVSQLVSLEPGKECPICLTELTDLSKVSAQRKHKKE
jgi:exonuclease SbcC